MGAKPLWFRVISSVPAILWDVTVAPQRSKGADLEHVGEHVGGGQRHRGHPWLSGPEGGEVSVSPVGEARLPSTGCPSSILCC